MRYSEDKKTDIVISSPNEDKPSNIYELRETGAFVVEKCMKADELKKWIEELIDKDELWRFYKSREWRTLKDKILKENHYECAECKKRGVITRYDVDDEGNKRLLSTVHHVQFVRKHPALALSRTYTYAGKTYQNLIPVCKVNDAINEVTTRLGDGTIADTMTQIDEKTGEVKDGTGVWSQKTEELFAKWQTGGATQKEVVSSIVADIQNAKTEQDKMNLAALAFGTMAEDGGTQFIQSISSVGDSFSDTKGKMDEVANTRYDDVGSSLEGLGRTLKQDIIQPIVTDAIPKVTEIIENVSNNVPLIVAKLQEMQPIITAIAVVIGVLTTAMAIQSAVTGVKAAMEAAETTTLWGLVAAQTAALAPYLLIAAAIAAVIAIIVLCVKHWDEIKQKVIEVAQILKEKMAAAWESVKESVSNGIAKVKGFFVNMLNWIKSNWQGLLLLLVNPFAGAFKLLYDNCSGFREFIDNFMSKIHETISNVGNKIKSTAKNIFHKVKEAITHPIETAKETISNLADKIKGIFEKLKIKLPDIKLPHFKISGGEAPWGIAGKGTKPTVDVEWYRAGAVLKRATQFGTSPSGTPMVGGEAGYEAIAPIDVLQGYVAEAVEAAGGTGQIDYDLLGEATAKACARMNITINLNGREIGRLERRPV